MKSVIKTAKTIDEAIRLGLMELNLSEKDCDIEILEEPKSGVFGIFGAKDAMVKITEKEDFTIDIHNIYGEETTKEINNSIKPEEVVKEVEKKEVKEEVKKDRQVVKKSTDNKPQEKTVVKEKLEETVLVEEPSEQGDLLDIVKDRLESIIDDMHIVAKVRVSEEKGNIEAELYDISESDTGIVIGRKGETLDALQYIISIIANKYSKEYVRVTLDVADYRGRRKESIENNARKTAYKVIKHKKAMAMEPMNSYERRIVHFVLQDYKEVETISQGKFPNRKVIIKYKG